MKKVLWLVAVVFVAVCIGALYLRSIRPPQQARAAQFVPENTLFFAQISDLGKTRERWKSTALCQLLQEPEMQAFLEKPRAKSALLANWEAKLAQIAQIGAGELFVAVTSLDGPPRIVAGFSFSGSRAQVEALLAEPRAALKKQHPAGKSDLVTYGATEIEIFSDKEMTVAGTFRDNWFLLASDLPLLEQTLDRFDLKTTGAGNTLEHSPLFASAIKPIPADRDALIYTRLDIVIERLSSLMAASGKAVTDPDWLAMKNVQAMAASTKLDGREFRDTIFVLRPGSVLEAPLPRHSLAATSGNTLLYSAMSTPANFTLPDSTLAIAALAMPDLGPIQKSLSTRGLGVEDLGKAFGPEIGILADWPATALNPSLVVALDVRDVLKAQAWTKALTESTPEVPWAKTENPGATIYSAQINGLASPSVALHRDFLFLGLSPEAVGAALDRLQSKAGTLAASPLFTSASSSITPPTGSFGYLDLRGLFERAYGTFRPFIIMSLAFAPEAGQYIDGGKLPSTEVIARHLGPMVLSQSTSAEGMLLESTGTVTLNQAFLGITAGSLVSFLPELIKSAQSPGFDPTQLLQLPKPAPAPSSPPTPALQEKTPPVQ